MYSAWEGTRSGIDGPDLMRHSPPGVIVPWDPVRRTGRGHGIRVNTTAGHGLTIPHLVGVAWQLATGGTEAPTILNGYPSSFACQCASPECEGISECGNQRPWSHRCKYEGIVKDALGQESSRKRMVALESVVARHTASTSSRSSHSRAVWEQSQEPGSRHARTMALRPPVRVSAGGVWKRNYIRSRRITADERGSVKIRGATRLNRGLVSPSSARPAEI